MLSFLTVTLHANKINKLLCEVDFVKNIYTGEIHYGTKGSNYVGFVLNGRKSIVYAWKTNIEFDYISTKIIDKNRKIDIYTTKNGNVLLYDKDNQSILMRIQEDNLQIEYSNCENIK